MRAGIIARYVGFILLLNALFMLISASVALFDMLEKSFFPLFLSACITALVGVFPLIFVPSNRHVTVKEVHLIVVFAWLACFVFGMLPYILYGDEFTLANAWFESVSGYTTTGSTILNNVESLPDSMLLWRAFTHFAGGVGVVLFALLVLPSFRSNKTLLAKAEVSSLALDNYDYKAQETVRVILTVYLSITAVAFFSLWAAGMNVIDSICHAFSTVATGGFSTKNASIAAFNSPTIELILVFFMVLSGMHFGVIYSTFTGRSNNLFRSPIVRFYLASLAVGTLIIAANLFFARHMDSIIDALRHALFQVVSTATTSGYATVDTSVWPAFSILILLYFMAQCSCAGSTSGGIKVDRIVILLKTIKVQVRRQQHPSAVIPVRVGDTKIDDDIVSSVLLFIVVYIIAVFLSTIILSLMGLSLLSGFSLSLSSISNVGPAFDMFSSLGSLSAVPTPGKYLLSFLMFLGRMELYGLLVLFYIRSWK